jgi:MFS superfamily sulfate permease-like transporter
MMLASAATIAAGFIFLTGSLLRLGTISEFISKPVLKGFVFGLGLTIMVKQAHKLMGISAGQGNFFHQAWHVITWARYSNLWTLGVALAAIANYGFPRSTGSSDSSALAVSVLGILSVSVLGLDRHHVEVVGTIHAGLPFLGLPRIGADNLADVSMGALGIVLVLTAEILAAGRTFASKVDCLGLGRNYACFSSTSISEPAGGSSGRIIWRSASRDSEGPT